MGRLIKANSGERPGLYLAYRYLMDGDSDNARRAVENDTDLNEHQKKIIDILGAAVEGDYPTLYFETRQMLDGKIRNEDQRSAVEELQQMAAAYLHQDLSLIHI